MAPSAKKQMRRLARAKLDEAGNGLRQILSKLPLAPKGGWIAAIREGLGMSQTDLARRLGVAPSSVAKLEISERAETVQLDTLRRAADALNCDVVVLVIPRQPLQASVDQRRLQLYQQEMERADVHMNLEAQPISETLRTHLLQEAEESIPDSVLWRQSRTG